MIRLTASSFVVALVAAALFLIPALASRRRSLRPQRRNRPWLQDRGREGRQGPEDDKAGMYNDQGRGQVLDPQLPPDRPRREQEDELSFKGETTWTVQLKPGRYTYQCDPHASQRHEGPLHRHEVTSARSIWPSSILKAARSSCRHASRSRYGLPAQRPMFSTSVRDGRARRREVRVEDGELVAVVLREPDLGIVELQLEPIRRGGRVPAGRVALRASVARTTSPQASFGSSCGACATSAARTSGGITTRPCAPSPLDVVALPEVGREVLPAAVGEDRDDDALVELRGELARDVRDRAGRDAGEDSVLVEQARTPAHGLLVRHEHLSVELGHVEDRRHVAVLERAQAHDGVARQRLGRGDDDVGEALAQASPAPISVPPVPRPATSTSTRSSASAISAPGSFVVRARVRLVRVLKRHEVLRLALRELERRAARHRSTLRRRASRRSPRRTAGAVACAPRSRSPASRT